VLEEKVRQMRPVGQVGRARGHPLPLPLGQRVSSNLLVKFEGNPIEVFSVSFSPDGNRVVTGSSPVQVWSAETGARLLSLTMQLEFALPLSHQMAIALWLAL